MRVNSGQTSDASDCFPRVYIRTRILVNYDDKEELLFRLFNNNIHIFNAHKLQFARNIWFSKLDGSTLLLLSFSAFPATKKILSHIFEVGTKNFKSIYSFSVEEQMFRRLIARSASVSAPSSSIALTWEVSFFNLKTCSKLYFPLPSQCLALN